ncbi:MAG: tryptophan-rich sensory protein [Acholeplasmataceae bacterium]|nr:MAG: tryptophan-rich sensory protein [Acholeplasmataceae bacterium]
MTLKTKIGITAAYLFMLVVNSLATILPINGITTGQISDNYLDLFAPFGLTFSIWGLIYILLGAYVVMQWLDARHAHQEKIGFLFIASSVVNGLWIFAWHYDQIFLSLLLMLLLLGSLIAIAYLITPGDIRMKLIFMVYFGWITVATIANVTTLLVQQGIVPFGLSEVFWTVFVIITGLIITVLTGLRFKSNAYLLVPLWAYFGILMKHLTFFDHAYPAIIWTTGVAMVVLLGFNLFIARLPLSRLLSKT